MPLSPATSRSGQVAWPFLWTPPAGAIAESAPRYLYASAGLATVSQTVYAVQIMLPANVLVSSVTFVSIAALVGGNHQYFGLADNLYQRLAVSADDGATAWGANAAKTLTMVTPYVTTYAGIHNVLVLQDAGTPATLSQTNAVAAGAVLTATPYPCALCNAAVTTIPATVTPATPNPRLPYAYVS